MVLTDSNDKEISVSAEMPVCIIKINRSGETCTRLGNRYRSVHLNGVFLYHKTDDDQLMINFPQKQQNPCSAGVYFHMVPKVGIDRTDVL